MSLEVKVEIAFTTDPDSTSPSWVDVSAWVDLVAGVEVTRGSGEEYSEMQPGTATFTLDNSDGRFTAGRSSSPYYPNVKIGRRVRVSMRKDAGSWVPRFDGFIDTWPMQWAPAAFYASATVTATDRLKRLGRQVFVDNIVSTVILGDGPSDYWDLGDPDGTVVPRNRVGTAQLRKGTPAATDSQILWGQGIGVGTDGLSALRVIDSSLAATSSAPYPFHGGAADHKSVTFEAFVRFEKADPATDQFQIVNAGGNALTPGKDVLTMFTTTGGVLRAAYAWSDLSTAYGVNGTTNLYDGRTHHVAAVFDSDLASITVYVDGAAENTVTGVTFMGGPDSGLSWVAKWGLPGTPPTATYSHIAAYTVALTATQLEAHARAGGVRTATTETSVERFDRIVTDLATIPAAATIGSPGTTNMAALRDITGKAVIDLLREVAATEVGRVFIATDGTLTFATRRSFDNQTPTITLPGGDYGVDLTFTLDDFGMLNDYTTTSGNGTVFRHVDTTSVAAYGTYSEQTDLATLDDNEAQSYSQMRVTGSQPQPRVSVVTIDVLTQPSLTDQVWAADLLGKLVKIDDLPSSAPASSVTLQIDAYTERFTVSAYDVTLNTSPAPASVWKLGDGVLGVLGSTTRLAH
jgi:Concanavalin A-like lectin/glucanases superfamily